MHSNLYCKKQKLILHGSPRIFSIRSKRKKGYGENLKLIHQKPLAVSLKSYEDHAVKRLIRSEYKRYLQHLSSQLKANPKRFWSYHSIKSKSKRLPEVITYNGRSVSKPQEQANLFNIHFHSVFVNRVLGYKLRYRLT